jgi:hypothetical protein
MGSTLDDRFQIPAAGLTRLAALDRRPADLPMALPWASPPNAAQNDDARHPDHGDSESTIQWSVAQRWAVRQDGGSRGPDLAIMTRAGRFTPPTSGYARPVDPLEGMP